MSEVTILANPKGGVGKTTTAVNLNIGLAAQEKSIRPLPNYSPSVEVL